MQAMRRWTVEHIVNPTRGVIGWYKKREKNLLMRFVAWGVTGAFALVMASFVKPYAVSWYVRHSREQHKLNIFISGFRTDQPKCSIFTVSLAAAEKIDSLHISLWFEQEIHQTILQRGYKQNGNNITIDLSASTPRTTAAPCEMTATPTEKYESLTFTTSADHHQLFIDGHDFGLSDTQTFFVALYPDNTTGLNGGNIEWGATGTYEQFGYQVPIRYSFNTYDGSSARTKHLFDTDERLVKLR